jgi:prevent-host-death family protein
MMTVMAISDARTNLSDLVNRAAYARERIVVTSHGTPRAALISIDDLRRLEELEELLAQEADTPSPEQN